MVDESKKNAKHADVVVWTFRKLLPIENVLYATGVFDLVKNYLVRLKCELLELLGDYPEHFKQVTSLQQKPVKMIQKDDLTDVLLWALRKLAPIDDRLMNTAVYDRTKQRLDDQNMQLVELLMQHPKHVKRRLLEVQHQKEKGRQNRGGNPNIMPS